MTDAVRRSLAAVVAGERLRIVAALIRTTGDWGRKTTPVTGFMSSDCHALSDQRTARSSYPCTTMETDTEE